MPVKLDFINPISIDKIAEWGLLRQLKIEEIIDYHLKKVPLPKEEIKNKIEKEWIHKNQFKSDEALIDWKKKNGLDERNWIYYLSRKWRWTCWCLNTFKEKIPNYYLERKSMLDQVNYSVIRVKNKNLSDELFLRIKENESTFEQIASLYSEGPEKNTSGHIGPMPLGNTHPVLSRLLKISQKNQIWSPRKIESWWIILKLNNLTQIPLNELTTQRLALELGDQYLHDYLDNFINQNPKN